jgi:hypothetical protein
VFRVSDKRRNADGDAQVRAQALVVASQNLAQQVGQQAREGEDFGTLACRHSLEATGGTGGDLGWVDFEALAPEIARALGDQAANGLYGPIQTAQGHEIVLVEGREFNIPNPGQVSEAAEVGFERWLAGRAASAFVVAVPGGPDWRALIPADPRPEALAPYLTAALLGIPTPTPAP